MYRLNSTGIEEQQKPPPNSQTRPPDLLAVAPWLSLGSSWSLQNREQSLAQSVSWQMWVVLGCQIKIHLEMQPRRRKPPSVPSTAPANQVSRLISCSGQVLGESFLTHRLQRWCYFNTRSCSGCPAEDPETLCSLCGTAWAISQPSCGRLLILN